MQLELHYITIPLAILIYLGWGYLSFKDMEKETKDPNHKTSDLTAWFAITLVAGFVIIMFHGFSAMFMLLTK